MTKKQRKTLCRIVIAAALYALAVAAPLEGMLRLAAFLAVYAIIGGDILLKAARNITRGQVFDENFLMSVATVGALCLGEYPEAVAVMLFYQIGELFQSYAVGKSRQSIAALMDIRPDYANVERGGKLEQVDPEEVAEGELIVVKPGERIPLDGVVEEGSSSVDTAALTGESVPREVLPGHEVISGCVNLSGMLKVRVSREFGQSTVARILDLVENSTARKSRSEHFITRFARYYTPAVVFAALALDAIPPLIFGQAFSIWVERALTFLVISCPCALVISIPLSFFGGIGGASRSGILVKGGNYLEALADVSIVAFDKTGTLTRGSFEVVAVHPEQIGKDDLLGLAALVESYSDHPISRSLREAWGREIDRARVSSVEEIPGQGVRAAVDGRQVAVGSLRLMESMGAKDARECHLAGTSVHVAADGAYSRRWACGRRSCSPATPARWEKAWRVNWALTTITPNFFRRTRWPVWNACWQKSATMKNWPLSGTASTTLPCWGGPTWASPWARWVRTRPLRRRMWFSWTTNRHALRTPCASRARPCASCARTSSSRWA